MKIRKVKIQIILNISPHFINDPDTEINKRLSSYLFRYTFKLSGIPICYKIIGIFPIGNIINDNESVFLKTVVEFDLLSFKIGDSLDCQDGIAFGIVYVKVDEDDSFTGQIKVIDVDTTNGDCTSVIGQYID